jgi:hypothetical protein
MATIETINSRISIEWFESLQFVSRAVEKKGTRPLLSCIRIERDGEKVWAYAADGFRLHIADITDCPPIADGLYTVLKSTKKELILQKEETLDAKSYPNVWNIIPDAPKCLDLISHDYVCGLGQIIKTMAQKATVNPSRNIR